MLQPVHKIIQTILWFQLNTLFEYSMAQNINKSEIAFYKRYFLSLK